MWTTGRTLLALPLALIFAGVSYAAHLEEVAAGDAPSACTEYSGICARGCEATCGSMFDGCCDPCWTVRSDAIFLRRSDPGSRVLAANQAAPGGTVVLNANQFDFTTDSGWDIYLARAHVLGDWGVEANFLKLDGWQDRLPAMLRPGPGNGVWVRLATPFGDDTASDIAGAYSSQLYSFEINGRNEITDRLTFLAGFRYVDLQEELGLTQDVLAVHRIDYAFNARNHLAGFQMGLDSQLLTWRRVSVEGILKAGIYGNSADNDAAITVAGAPAGYSSASKCGAAFVGELDFAALYAITDHLAVRGGYQMLWIDGVALASRQLEVSDPLSHTGAVDARGTVFYHGAFVGLEYRR